jgi:hypothetical protein
MKTIITRVEKNRVVKFLPIEDENAQSKLSELIDKYPNAFIYDGSYSRDLWVENGVVTLVPFVEPIMIPQTVTMRQARLALLGAGMLDDVNTAINNLPSPQKEAAQIEWEYSQEVHRNKALVAALLPALGMTSEQADQLFIAAAQL